MTNNTGKLTLEKLKSLYDSIGDAVDMPTKMYVDPNINQSIFDGLLDPKMEVFEKIGKKEEYKLLKNLRKSSNQEDYITFSKADAITYSMALNSGSIIKHGKLTGITGI